MKKITRILAAVMLLCMALTLCACGEDQPTTTTTKAPEATTTVPAPSTTVTVPPTTVNDGKVEYIVTVLYPDGTPVVGKSVIVCEKGEGGMCSMPSKTDENGVAVIRMEEKDIYGAKLVGTVEGYQKMEDYVYFEAGSREVTITLVPVE